MIDILSLITSGKQLRKRLKAEFSERPYHVVMRTRWGLGWAKWYCYDHLASVSKARAGELSALAKQADLNLTRDDLKTVSSKQAEIAEQVKADLMSYQRRAASLLQSKPDPNQIKALITDLAKMEEFILPSVRIWENLNTEISKRCDLLTHPNFLYRAAAILYWTDGEDPDAPVGPAQMEKKVAAFKKKEALLPLLRSPIATIFYHVEASRDDLVISLMESLRVQSETFLRYGDEILASLKTRSLTPNYNSDSGFEMKKSPSSNPSEEMNLNSESGPVDPKKIFSDMLKKSD